MTSDEPEITASDSIEKQILEDRSSQAHIERKFPSTMSQIGTVYMLQMRLFTKSKTTYKLLILVALIPVLAYSGLAEKIVGVMMGAEVSISYLLFLLPLMIPMIAAMLSGRIISSEFRNRTAYFNFPLPVSRTTFYFGRFLAAMTVSFGIFMLAYGLAVFSGSGLYQGSYPNDIVNSFIICIMAVFAIAGMAYGLGPYFKRGSMGITVILTLLMPFLLMTIIGILPEYTSMTDSTADKIMDYLSTLPPFAGFKSLMLIDGGVGGAFINELFKMFTGGKGTIYYVSVSAVWGAAFLMLGLLKVKNKEL